MKDLLFSTPAPNVNAWRSGLLLNEKKFVYNRSTSNFELKEEIKNVFEKFNERVFSNHIVKLTVVDRPGIRSSYSLNAYQEGACDYRKISDTLLSYNSTGKFEKFTDYIFSNDTLVQLKETRNKDSKARTTVTNYTYVQDLPTRTAAEDSLLKYFRIGIPLKTEVYKDDNLLSTRLVKYKDWGNGVVEPEKISEAYQEFPLKEKISVNAYDRSGNILDIQKSGEPREAYLWGYNDLYPVAKVIGKGYDNIKNLVDRSILKNTNGSFSNQDIRTELSKLYTGVPGAGTLINTFTYIPLIGTDTETDPAGKTTYYEYDGGNRLAWIRDDEDKILKKYKYKVSEESAASTGGPYYSIEKKGVFHKNNCLIGQQGSLVTYIVPANTYSSAVSQTDADKKAQEDVYANGQSFANSNGTCSGASLPVTIYQSAAKNRLITKNSCVVGLTIPVLYSVPAGRYQSDISQDDADRKAESEINVKGQAYANTNGICLEQLTGPMDMYLVDPNTWTTYAVGSYYFATSVQELCNFFDPLWVPPPPPFFPIPNPVPTPINPVVHITIAIHTINSTPVSYSHSQFNSLTQVAINAFAPDGYYINKQASRNVPAGQRIIYELKDGRLVNLILCQ